MTEVQLQLQNALTTTFLANLAFLSEYDNELYHRIDEFSRMIENGTYEEKYALEFIREDGDFDIYDIVNDKYIYDKQPMKAIKKAISQINFDTKGTFSIIETNFFTKGDFLKDENIFNEVGYKLKKDIDDFTEVLKDDLSTYNHKKLKNIDKFIFIGTLLGRHIPKILKKINAKNFFVCERNLEIFRLSLFIVDYSSLAREGRTAVFSIMDTKHDFNLKSSIFLRNDYHQNYAIKYYTTDYDVSEYFDEIMDSLISQKSITFNHYMMIDNVAKLALSRVNNYNIIHRELSKINKLFLQEKPILYIGAGPSLSDNIEWISRNKEFFIIVSIGASCKKLLSFDIIPDIVVTLDPQFKVLNEIHFDKETTKKLENTIILASMNTDERILNKFNKKNLFLYEVIFSVTQENKVEDGYSVGEIVGTLLINLGVQELYLIGIDLAINQETGDTHISGYETSSKYDLEKVKSSMEKNTFSLRGDLIKVKGNFKDEVYTTRLFNTSLNAFSLSIEALKKENQYIYNISQNGAYIAGTIPLNITDIKVEKFTILNKDIMLRKIKEDFLSISRNQLTNKDFEIFQKEKKYLLEIKENLLEKEKRINNFMEFTTKYLNLEKLLLTPKIQTIFSTAIFSFYFRSITPYLFYCFNEKNIKKEVKKINEVNNIMNKQLSILVNRYISYIDIALLDKEK
jgi:hypothetical protein